MSVPQEQVQQAQTVTLPKRWPLVSDFQSRSSATPLTKDARLINGYAEYDPVSREYWVYKRFGLSLAPAVAYTPATGTTPNGMYTLIRQNLPFSPGPLYFVAGNSLYSFQAPGPASRIIDLNVNAGSYTFDAQQNAAGTISVVANGMFRSYMITGAGAGASVLDLTTIASFPTNLVPGVVVLDGSVYLMDNSGNVYGSNINDPATWNALNIIPANSNSDAGIAITKQLSYVIALKQYTTQVFYDAGGSPGTPLAPVPDAQLPLGCAAGFSIQSVDNVLLWLSSNQTSSPQVVQLTNLVPKIVSTPAVERILDGLQFGLPGHSQALQALNVSSWVIKHAGHRLYGLILSGLGFTLVYDLDQEKWYIWTDTTGTAPWPIQFMGFGQGSAAHYGFHSNGSIYLIDGSYAYPNDAGVMFPVDIYTPDIDFGTRRKKQLGMMFFNADKVASKLEARYSEDDYQTWSNPRLIDLNLKRPRLPNCGSFSRRAYHFRHYANTALRIKTVDLQMDLGTQ